jgi:hypothetical protein
MLTDNLSVGHYLLSQCQGYVNFPPNNQFALGRMSYILELTNMMGYGQSETFSNAQKVFAKIAPQLAAKTKKKKGK